MTVEILDLLTSIVMLVFVMLCRRDVIPMNKIGWIVLAVLCTFNLGASLFKLF